MAPAPAPIAPPASAPVASPSRAFAGRHLVALVQAELAVVVAINSDCVVKIDHPVIVHCLQLVKYLRCPVHIFLETYNYELCHVCCPLNEVGLRTC